MKHTRICLLLLLGVLLQVTTFYAQSSHPGHWQEAAVAQANNASGKQLISAKQFRLLSLDLAAMRAVLAAAPMEGGARITASAVTIAIPFPDGKVYEYFVNESPIMAPELLKGFPSVRTYSVQAKDFEGGQGRVDVTDFGFHAMLFTPNGTVFIDPYLFFNTRYYMSYFARDLIPTGKGSSDGTCVVDNPEARMEIERILQRPDFSVKSGSQLRTYRLALAADGEYTAFCGGTVAGAYSQMVTTMNRVNGVYINDLCIKMNLVANTQNLIYTNASTDPYTNTDGATMLTENQTTVDNVIGSANYDIGHVFSTGGGGIAGLGVVCRAGNKARGVTGSSSPTGDSYDIDYVAHEMGHQFGGNHTFNSSTGSCGSGNRNSTTAYENGSGTTIMAYAGICGADNLQSNSDPYFHTKSIDEIIAYSQSGSGNSCPVTTSTGNTAPTLTLPTSGYTIPISTPFSLTATATDADGDALTYCWEEFDLGAAGTVGSPSGNAPIFRSFNPVSSGTRYFPKLSSILNNTTTFGEMLPTYSRTLTFKCTVRDNRVGGGGVTNTGTVAYTVTSAAGPFQVTAPNTAVSWGGSSAQTVTWSVASTNASPVSCASVNILLSTDGGTTWPYTLASATPNDGSQLVTLPNLATTTARVKVEAVGNIFFDLSNTNFTITSGTPNTAPAAPQGLTAVPGNTTVLLRWRKNTEADFLRYRVYGGTSANPVTLVDSTTGGIADTARTISALATGTTYYFRVTAVDSVGAPSGYSNEVQVTTNAAPAAPLSLTAGPGTTTVTLRWRKSPETDVLRYRVYGGTSANPVTKIDSANGGRADTVKTISGLTPGETYFYRVTAVDSLLLESPYSAQAQVTTNLPPAAPQNLNAKLTGSSITLRWSMNSETDFLRYRVYGGTSPNPSVKLDSTSGGIADTFKTITGLLPATTYYYRVTAVDSSLAESGYSNQVNSATVVSITLLTPANAENWRANSNRVITWLSSGVTTVSLYYSSNNGAAWQPIVQNIPDSPRSVNWLLPVDSSGFSKIKVVNVFDTTVYGANATRFNVYLPEVVSSAKSISLQTGSASFGGTNVTLNFDSKSSGTLAVDYYPYESPDPGTLPPGIQKAGDFYWKITPTAAQFTNVYIKVPTAQLRGGFNPATLVWMKRANPGEAWVNIGGTVNSGNLVSTSPFSSFSEFTVGTSDSTSNPLPVELTAFTARVKGNKVMLKWETATELNAAGFEVQRALAAGQWQPVAFIKGAGNSNAVREYSYTDTWLTGGSYRYRLKLVDIDGTFDYSAAVNAEIGMPVEFDLAQNYPNPFNPVTVIRYTIPQKARVNLQVFSLNGTPVQTLVDGILEPGYYSAEFGSNTLPSGVYLYRLTANGHTIARKMAHIK